LGGTLETPPLGGLLIEPQNVEQTTPLEYQLDLIFPSLSLFLSSVLDVVDLMNSIQPIRHILLPALGSLVPV